MLFGDREGIAVLSVYILAIFAASIMTAYHSILQSLGQYKISLVALATGLTVQILRQFAVGGTAGDDGSKHCFDSRFGCHGVGALDEQ